MNLTRISNINPIILKNTRTSEVQHFHVAFMSSDSDDSNTLLSREYRRNYDKEVTGLTAYLRQLNFKQEKSKRELNRDRESLRRLKEEIAKKESSIRSNDKRIDSCKVKLDKFLTAQRVAEERKRQRKVATPYKITSFDGKSKIRLYVGDTVYTNDGQGVFKGRFIATVVSPSKQENRVILRFNGVSETTTRDIKFLRHAYHRDN